MKKIQLAILLSLLLLLVACNNNQDTSSNDSANETITYESETGPVQVPANPERVVVLSSYVGDLIKLGVNVVGVDVWSADNPNFKEATEGAEVVSNEDLEKIIELDPDLIIGLNTIENAAKLEEIAPTVLFTYGKNDYIQQHIEIGKVVNKEEEARAWAEDFQARMKEVGEKIRAKIGEDATVTVIENYEKQFYLFGNNWGRGTEILYQGMGLKMPKEVEDVALEPGYFAISQEVLADYVGDYVILSLTEDQDTSFLEENWYKEIEAVQNDRVYTADIKGFTFNDALSLDDQLDFFEEKFLESN
ncbi:iron-hydroxamate ABC transporter substrate-binding protein [Ornithinibacillus contaminans]|uniref:iron-hydroxamate ABC transporter substrate-binding protein n=1 Tax=Ornithinibacillus contaminans TaxID=694055 RepID=UPI00064DE4CB|nr:iron-hydroxamate ABC transporter substrate-binding protein [Ornithinibacillus contaminans]